MADETRSGSIYFVLYLHDESRENKLRPVIIQVPDSIIGQAGAEQRV